MQLNISFYPKPPRSSDSKFQLEWEHQKQKLEFEEILISTKQVFEKYVQEAKLGYHKKTETNLPYSLILSEEGEAYLLLKQKSRKETLKKFSPVGEGGLCKVTFCYDFKKKKYCISRSLETKGFLSSQSTEKEIEINKMLKEEPNYFATGKAFQYFSHKNKTTFIMKYFEGGSLKKAVQRGKIRALSSEKRIGLVKHLVTALNLLHVKFRYCHHDLKLENVVLTKDFEPRLIDFGCSSPIDEDKQKTSGTPLYLPPEWKNSQKGDIWALGVLLLNIKYEGFKTWAGNAGSAKEFFNTICTPELLNKKLDLLLQKENYENPKHLDSIIYKCLAYQPTMRPTAEKILALLKDVEIG